MPCAYTTPSPNPLNFERYRNLHPDGKRLVKQWFDRALVENSNQQGSQFEAFIFLWFAFNGFAACVTVVDRDAEIIRKVGNCPDLRRRFIDLQTQEPEFANRTAEFASYWPIFRVQDLRRLSLLHSSHGSRREMVDHYLSIPGAGHEPECYEFHRSHGQEIPADWPHTLQAIYRVRCNLFHGEKSPSAEIDIRIVRQAFLVLSMFIQRVHLL